MHSGMETHGKGRAGLGWAWAWARGEILSNGRGGAIIICKKGWYLHGEDGQARQAA